MFRLLLKILYMSIFILTLATVVLCYLFVIGSAQADTTESESSFAPLRRETNVELLEDDERDVFQDFKTSYIPLDISDLDDGVNIKSTADLEEEMNGNSINGFTKRDHLPCEADEIDVDTLLAKSENEMAVDMLGKEGDHGPVDDVLEVIRGQPELEDAELPQKVLLNNRKKYKCLQTFWKGEGDRDAIRKNQAAIMKQYLNPNIDPCDDFYEFACGNWAPLNPIPADKTGLDTFEVLRENLNYVLKDLLTTESSYKDKLDDIHLELSDQKKLDEAEVNKTNNPDEILLEDLNDLTEKKKEMGLTARFSRETQSRIKMSPNFKFKTLIGRLRQLASQGSEEDVSVPVSNMHRTENDKSNEINTENEKHSIMKPAIKNANEKDTIETRKTAILEGNDPANGDATLKAKFLYESCMNYDILQERGHQPLLDLLEELGGWPLLNPEWQANGFDWVKLMAELRLYNNEAMISEWVGPDMKNSEEFIIQIDQTTLGLPSREFYLHDSNLMYLMAYKNFLVKVATLLGGDAKYVNDAANDMIIFETKLSSITATADSRRNVTELYNRMSLKQLMNTVPGVDWCAYLNRVTGSDVPLDQPVVVFALPYVKSLVKLVSDTEPEVVANYILWRFVRHRVNNLDDRFAAAKQEFYYVLLGREESPPRWKRCVTQVNQNMGMALGSMFVKKYFDEHSKEDTLDMTKDIQSAFKDLLTSSDWLDDETRDLAAKKVDAMILRIGYPDFLTNEEELNEKYDNVIIHPERYFENTLIILRHLTKIEQARLGQQVNKAMWNTAPAVVNAYYSRNKNQILVPAGILQPPFYHKHFPRSLNYGGIGVVIGHEITHGFDDKGRLFDVSGNLNRWWKDSAVRGFHKRAQCLVDQYGKYVVPELGIKLDGISLQGENIADNGGVKQAFHAYKKWLSDHGDSDESLPDFNASPGQLFFLNYAQIWCGAMRPESVRNKMKTAVHSPGRFRVIGALSNSEDFAREFKCPLGSNMNPRHKCSVW